ncbi:sugar phosphate nucleotidyltransferase [Candidatus Margulisiibacteriota bacterium]
MENVSAIVLAAGKGVRMKSELPKVMHPLLGKPLLAYVIETLHYFNISSIHVVVGYKKELIENQFASAGVDFIWQQEQLGTGHAVLQAEEAFNQKKTETVLVLAGDVPLLKAETLKALVDFHNQHNSAATDLTAIMPDAGNYGRVIRDRDGHILKIVEKKDATEDELKIKEINTGTFCFNAAKLFAALKEVRSENAQGEYYLTDTIEILKKQGHPVFAFAAPDYKETVGINTKEQLLELEKTLQN